VASHIGRPVFATNATGAKVWTATYLPFGGVHTSTGALPTARFPGQWFQSESGLHQNWMRDYDPTTGRYLQADPLGLVDGASVYGYALQNPLRYVDPTGLQTGVGAPTPNRLTQNVLEECCEKHHPIPSAYLPLVDGRKPRQKLTPMEKARHAEFHRDLDEWMAKNCVKCIGANVWVNAAFGGVQSGEFIQSNFDLAEIIGCLDRFWVDAKSKYPDVYVDYLTNVANFRKRRIF
jgi:RHS repeat-associated protein